jgi:hypothetical protein
MTPDQSRAMALWMKTAPYDRKWEVQERISTSGIDPWLLLTRVEQAAAMTAYAEQGMWTGTPLTASEITEISLSRGMCEGECPVYRVTLTTDGLVDFEGEAFVELIGQHQGFVDPDRVDDLVRIILRLGFAELLPEYPTMVTDQPSTELSLTAGDRRHLVVDHGGAPLEFWAMAATVDAVIGEVEWDEPEDDDDDRPGDLGLPALD